MRLVVLGGTRFVGRAICAAAHRRGYDVVVFNRGQSGPPPSGALAVRGDRTMISDLRQLAKMIDDRGGADLIIDPACYAPSHALMSARILKDIAPGYAVVSTVTAHRQWPAEPVESGSPIYDTGITEGPSTDMMLYGRLKAGVERAVETIFGEINTLVLRPGVVLGPNEDLGRLPDYLRRSARGDGFVVGGSPDMGFQYVDVRDLAEFVLTCAETGRPGRYDVVTPPGQYTWGDLAGSVAEVTGGTPVFVSDDDLVAAGVEPWRGLPLWVPAAPDNAGLWSVDGRAAFDYGFAPRPLAQTVADTWTWLQKEGLDWEPTSRAAVHGIDPQTEQELLAAAGQ
ncbi:MAG: NAD-dependent epimerase/dehydratase family protein [Micrococcales bacterium]|nr:NAD-dependent epimerase/dehydratase family protein [Micrococcales bacterium]